MNQRPGLSSPSPSSPFSPHLIKALTSPLSRASMIWILGEYCDRIDSVDELLTTFLDNFADENSQVSTITTSSKLGMFF